MEGSFALSLKLDIFSSRQMVMCAFDSQFGLILAFTSSKRGV